MKKLVFASLFVVLLSSSAVAQAPQLYAELGGPGVASLNFDSRFTKKESGIGGRVGFGGFTINGTGILFVPVGINYLLGKEGTKNFFELGAGATFVSVTDNGSNGDPDSRFNSTFGHLTLGYRYQPVGSGVTFRVAINPIIGFESGTFWPLYGGVSVGYKFK
jgi:hypothetical protein